MRRFLACRRGVTMLEYSLIAALVAIVAVSTLSVLGRSVSSEFSKVQAAMSPVKPSAT